MIICAWYLASFNGARFPIEILCAIALALRSADLAAGDTRVESVGRSHEMGASISFWVPWISASRLCQLPELLGEGGEEYRRVVVEAGWRSERGIVRSSLSGLTLNVSDTRSPWTTSPKHQQFPQVNYFPFSTTVSTHSLTTGFPPSSSASSTPYPKSFCGTFARQRVSLDSQPPPVEASSPRMH
jgi:hypothetical protein